ncbi:hypothetical protein LMTR3_12585 [Bradyrhizobium sp. LMTR 3]|nr:hypothetical protein LMTR3_12585 [Bradyrhizobium sp. LMTR 3]
MAVAAMLPIPFRGDVGLPSLLPTFGGVHGANALVAKSSDEANQWLHLHFFFALGFAFVGGGAAASRASRSAFRRSRFFANALCAISYSLIAVAASTWRNALRASRSALVI